MATLTPAFRRETGKIHHEHDEMRSLLTRLDLALDRLVCDEDAIRNSASIEEIRRVSQQLGADLPEHCRREEAVLFRPVEEVSPQLQQFCGQMREEHQELLAWLAMFLATVVEYDRRQSPRQDIWNLKKEGRKLTTELTRHMDREEQELSGFL